MNKQKKQRRTEKRWHSHLGNWHKVISYVLTATMCFVVLACIMSVPTNNSQTISTESEENQYETYNIDEETSNFPIYDVDEQLNASLYNVESKNQKPSNDSTEVQKPKSTEFELTEPKPTEPEPTKPKEPAETEEPTEPEKPTSPIESSEPTEPKEPIDDQPSTTPTEDNQQTSGEDEGNYSSDSTLEEILDSLCVAEGQNTAWKSSQNSSGETSEIWIEQYEPLTDELIIGLGNLIMQEVGGYISTQSYKKAMKSYMLTGSVVLHRLEVKYRKAETVYDVVHSPSQYGAKWAFDRKTRVKGSVDECYVVAERLLRDGPIGPRNLVYQSGSQLGDPYWNTGKDPIYLTTYFGTNPKFADYDEI